jgi:hypothetical protein
MCEGIDLFPLFDFKAWTETILHFTINPFIHPNKIHPSRQGISLPFTHVAVQSHNNNNSLVHPHISYVQISQCFHRLPDTTSYQFHNPQIMPYVPCFYPNRVYSHSHWMNLRGMKERTFRLQEHQRGLQQHSFHINSFTHDSVSSLWLFCSSTSYFLQHFYIYDLETDCKPKKIERETLAKLSGCPGSEHAAQNNNTFNIFLYNCYHVYSNSHTWGVKHSE